MLTSLVDILRRAGLDFSPRELQDILLLADRLGAEPDRGDAIAPSAKPLALVDESLELAPPPAGNAKDQPVALPRPDLPPVTDAEPVHLHAGTNTGHIRGNTLRISGVTPLSAPVDYRRALHPFMRRLPVQRSEILDEDATAINAINTGVWMPAYRPARERWFDVILLIEDTPSVDVWQEELERLAITFRSQSGMRNVSIYRLVSGSHPYLISTPSGTVHNIEQLHRSSSRQLIVYATDGTSADWRNGRMRELLAPLCSVSQVSIMQLLPQRNWRHTALGEPMVKLYAAYPGQANSALHAEMPWWLDLDATDRSLHLPALSLLTNDIAAWAQVAHARGSASISGWLVPAGYESSAIATPMPVSPAEHLAAYQHSVSQQAYDLAVFLSAVDPLTIPIMRLVMRAMLPNAGNDVLAEFLVGGLLEQLSPKEVMRDEREYRFRPGLRDQLASALRFSESRRIEHQLHAVGRLITEQSDTDHTLTAYFPSPDGKPHLSEWNLPFAAVSLRALAPKTLAAVTATTEETATVFAPAPVRSVPVGGLFRILHLSDLHVGAESPTAWHDRPEFGQAWDNNLLTITAYGRVDLLCISGDLTWNGKSEDFDQLSIFLDRTLSILELDRSRLCVVPGNHDMQPGFGRLSESYEEQQEIFARNYLSWANTYLGRTYSDTSSHFDYGIKLIHHGAGVLVLEWDSAYRLRDRHDSTDALHALERLLQNANDVQSMSMRVVISHVPLSAMSNREQVEKLFHRFGVQLIVHSHRRAGEDGGWQMAGAHPTLVSRVGGTASRGGTAGDMQLLAYMLDGRNSLPQLCWQRLWSPALESWESGDTAYWDRRGQPEHFVSPEPPSPLNVPFVGRMAELNELGNALAEAHPYWISGIKGMGKTALALQLATRYWSGPISWFDASINGNLRVNLMHATGASYPPDAFYSRMRTELRKHHTLLIIDNVDNEDQQAVIQTLLQDLEGCSILVLAQVAPTALTIARHIALRPLSDQEAQELIHALAPTVEFDTVTQARLIRASGGVPRLLVSELRKMKDSRIKVEEIDLPWRGQGHHSLIADSALTATLTAYRGDRKAGVLAQTVGTGLASTLMYYLERCQLSLPAPYYVVLTDRVSTTEQLRAALNSKSASVPPVFVPGSAAQLEHMLDEGRSNPSVVITTVQMLARVNRQDAPCVVIYFSLHLPTIRYMQKFPNGTLIVFAQFPLLSPLDEEIFGATIRPTLPQLQAASHAVKIDQPAGPLMFLKKGAPDLRMIEHLAQFILSDYPSRAGISLAAPVVVVPSVAVAEIMTFELKRWKSKADGNIFNAATKSGQRDWLRYHAEAEFRSTLFVVTSNQLASGQFAAPTVCYICCPLPKAARINLLFHAGRRSDKTATPVIVDLVGIDWPREAPTLVF